MLHPQLEAAGVRVLAGGVVQHGAAAHAAVPRVPRHLAHAAALQPRPPDARHAGLLPAPHQAPRHLLLAQLRPAAQTGMILTFHIQHLCLLNIFTPKLS